MLPRQLVFSAEQAACMGLCVFRHDSLLQTTSHLLLACTARPISHKKASHQISHPHSADLLGPADAGIACGSRSMEFAHHLPQTSKRGFWGLNTESTELLPMATSKGP